MFDEFGPGGGKIVHLRLFHAFPKGYPVFGELELASQDDLIGVEIRIELFKITMLFDEAQSAHDLLADSSGLQIENTQAQQETTNYHEGQDQMTSKA
ncbi:MAG: hypothetical protein HQM00_08315 [Magnetococcales bacterium]|nr:hypothetical protein [Magnetococcales bacterium]